MVLREDATACAVNGVFTIGDVTEIRSHMLRNATRRSRCRFSPLVVRLFVGQGIQLIRQRLCQTSSFRMIGEKADRIEIDADREDDIA